MSTHTFSGPFTSESVGSGHPDKVADLISDTLLDAHLAQDPSAHVAIETLAKDCTVVVAGEVTSRANVDTDALVRRTIAAIGYNDPANPFNAGNISVVNLIGQQSPDIAQGVGAGLDQGAGDQGLVFGFACKETPALLPLPISLAHAITRTLEKYRRSGAVNWLRPDAKSQVTVRYLGGIPVEVTDVVVSTQHAKGFDQGVLKDWVLQVLLPDALGPWHRASIRAFINPTGVFDVGGPVGDCGLTGRKIIVDTYGGYARHGGGAFSGKDPSKVDRSAAYFARWVARQIVLRGLAKTAEVQIAYAIGVARPVAWHVDTRGTGDDALCAQYAAQFDGRPGAIIQQFDLRRPLYAGTTNYGHFGKADLPWEN
ncbi:S-adenosylmethionine synthetase [Verrucomicrobia bacterium IMCC26134]|nr:S-adenosylmethionine synthetase [Verrucomicrobia bacterium IMCC26134]